MFPRKSRTTPSTVFGVLNGPNLNRIGKSRAIEHYGATTYEDLEQELMELAETHEVEVMCFQSHEEGKLIELIHNHDHQVAGWIINPGALMMYGYSLADAIEDSTNLFIEVHISAIYRREPKRHHSVLSPYCYGQISGLGTTGYKLALLALIELTDSAD